MKSALAAMVVLFGFVAQTGSRPADNVDCLVQLEIPRYTFVARRAATTGTVEAHVLVGREGKIDKMQTTGADPNLGLEVEGFLKKSSFLPSCHGREVRLFYTFRLEGEARLDPFAIVSFRPPNHFIITSQPWTPIFDRIPVTPGRTGRKD